jgi:hypothetical protein
MKSLITTLLLFYAACLFGQSDTTVIQTFYPNQSVYDEYQISLPDSNKNGYFKRFTKTGRLHITGQYKNNERTGKWVWFPYTEARYRDTVEVYDYDTRTEIYFRDTAVTAPRYPGGDAEFGNDVGRQLIFPNELMTKYDGKSITAYYKLSCTGKITDVKFTVKCDFRDKVIEDIIIAALTKDYPLWIPCKDPSWDNLTIRFGLPITIKLK